MCLPLHCLNNCPTSSNLTIDLSIPVSIATTDLSADLHTDLVDPFEVAAMSVTSFVGRLNYFPSAVMVSRVSNSRKVCESNRDLTSVTAV